MLRISWTCSRCLRRSLWLTQKSRVPQARISFRSYSSASSDVAFSSVMLNRARSIAAEHTKLSEQLTESFDTKTAKRVGELAPVTKALNEWDNANESIAELRSLLQDPSTDNELRDLAAEDLESTKSNLVSISSALKQSLIPRHPFGELPCLIEIRPGAGGDEAGLFAFELLRMYTSFCSRQGLRVNILKQDTEDNSASEERLTEAVMEIENAGSYDIMRSESGVHRVQRVPATEAKGRTHTSAVSVMILPSFPSSGEGDNALNFEDPTSDYYVDPQEVQYEKMRASGAGGQHVNKTESAVRLTHIPTGTVVGMQESRSQHENRRKAWQVLRARIAEARREAREQEMVKFRRGAMGGVSKMGRGDKVRTYNWGQSRCTDHRSGMTVHNIGEVMEGGYGLEKIMESVRSWLVDQEVDAMIAEANAQESDANSGKKNKKKA